MPRTRQLVAIMFTDIQGYTAMMQQDEAIAIKIRDSHRKIFNSNTEKFNGKILQYFGDGTLSTFKSAIDAVKCAMEMQMAFQKEPVIPVRIGIHIGDIVITDDDIIGDGVNVASRIESLSVPGSVFISGKVYDEIKNHSSIETKSLRTFELKNVDKPMEVFAISNKGLIVPKYEKISGKTKDTLVEKSIVEQRSSIEVQRNKKSWILYSVIFLLAIIAGYFILKNITRTDAVKVDLEKSIAVLPFTNMTNDPDQEYFSDGITEDILTHLSKVADLRVVSRTSTLQYKNTTKTIPQIGKELGVSTVLEGSVRKAGNQVRITAQLIDAKTDEHIWAETYDRKIDKIFDIQTEVAREILKVLKAKLTSTEEKRLDKSITSEITAYDYYLRGTESLINGETYQDLQNAAMLFKQAIEIDTEFASAYVGLAKALMSTRVYGTEEPIWRDSALILSQIALSLDSDLDEAHYLQSMYYLLIGETGNAVNSLEKVLEINPNHEKALIELGSILMVENELERGINLIVDGMMLKLNRKDPEFYCKLGESYYQIGEMEKAKRYLNQAIKLKPDYNQAFYWLLEVNLSEKDYKKVLYYAQKMVDIEKHIFSLDRLGWAYMLVHDYNNAIDTWSEISEFLSGYEDQYYVIAYKHRLAYVLWQTGQREKASVLFEEFIQKNLEDIENKIEKDILGQPYDLAACYAFIGDEKEAMKWVQIAAKGFFPTGMVARDPMFDNIRENENFQKIILQKKKEEEENKPRFDLIQEKLRELEKMEMF